MRERERGFVREKEEKNVNGEMMEGDMMEGYLSAEGLSHDMKILRLRVDGEN